MIVKLSDVTKIIRKNKVINDISVSFESGYVYGLCGYNGCGKTMLMRLIAGLIIPTKGFICIDGKYIGKNIDFPPDMGLLIESPAFLNNYSGYDNLMILASIRGKVSKSEIHRTLYRVGLNEAERIQYRKYSLGMKQRLGIAAAIMESPALIILDEPMNALDADGIELTKKIIQEEKNRGAIIIMTCHDKQILYEMSDVIFHIEHGSIINQEVMIP